MFLRQPIIANDYFTIITIIGPTINRSDASLKSYPTQCAYNLTTTMYSDIPPGQCRCPSDLILSARTRSPFEGGGGWGIEAISSFHWKDHDGYKTRN